MRSLRTAAIAVGATAVIGAATGCQAMNDIATSIDIPSQTPVSTQTDQVPEPGNAAVTTSADVADALILLGQLPVKGRAPKTGYSRAQFGKAWTDDVNVEGGHNSCPTREDILARDLVDIVYMPGKKKCKIKSGTLHDSYTGKTIHFQRGEQTSSMVQIDHRVALSNAWQTGAQQLAVEQRTALANDPANLVAVDGPTNQKKSDGDAATWLPPLKSGRCQYVSAQIKVKHTYQLWVTPPEKQAMERILSAC